MLQLEALQGILLLLQLLLRGNCLIDPLQGNLLLLQQGIPLLLQLLLRSNCLLEPLQGSLLLLQLTLILRGSLPDRQQCAGHELTPSRV